MSYICLCFPTLSKRFPRKGKLVNFLFAKASNCSKKPTTYRLKKNFVIPVIIISTLIIFLKTP